MRIPRVYQIGEYKPGKILQLSSDGFQHIVKVLRLSLNSKLILFNGTGDKAEAEIIEISKKNCSVKLNKILPTSPACFELILAQAIIKSDKMDWLVQKAVELGVTKIVPIISENCQIKLDRNLLEKKCSHWKKIMISACEQSGVDFLPKFAEPQTLSEFSNNAKATLKFVLDPYAEKSIQEMPKTCKEVIIVVGPEGGFTKEEINLLENKNFIAIMFGKRILRSETASLAILSISQFLWG